MTYIFAGIDHVQLAAPAGCETEARWFYGKLLGWTEVSKPEDLAKRGGVWFQCGSHQVHIGIQSDFVPATKAHPAFHVHHLAKLREHLLLHNISLMDDEFRQAEGITRFFLHDPFGNRIEFLERMQTENKSRFSNRVEDYTKFRPSYPLEAIGYLYETIGFNADSIVADIGAGTGIFTKLLLEHGSQMVAVEPNQAMREEADRLLQGYPKFSSIAGSAEATNLADHSVDYIVCAQAFHWFDQVAAQMEFRRILKPGGKAVLVWNARQSEGTPFREEYEQLLRKFGTDYLKVNHRNITKEALAAFFKDGELVEAKFQISQELDFVGLSGRLSSASYIPKAGQPSYPPMMEELQQLFDRTKVNNQVSIDYETQIFWGEV